MIIGLFGFDFVSSNKGCEALTYSFLNMISHIAGDEAVKIYNFTYNDDLGKVPDSFSNFEFERIKINLKSPTYWKQAKKILRICDVFCDATFGDGFSDIYGKKWNVKTNLIKQLVLNNKVPLVLVPQTFGPFESQFLNNWSMKLIKQARIAYSRDDLSAKIVKDNIGIDIDVASDMAFKLPFDSSIYSFNSDKIKVGINVSSLLWDSEWARENHFGLSLDYNKYCTDVIETLIADEGCEVHIIPHVIDKNDYMARENDCRACDALREKYGDKIILAPAFDTPIQAKSYISNMDVFIGARMHATIGAISSGVATIPFSYSRKFEGLFGNINYPYVISAREVSTEEALANTLKWISEKDELKKNGKIATELAWGKLEKFEQDIKELLYK